VTYIWATNDVFMEKNIKHKKAGSYTQGSKISKAEEPEAVYNKSVKKIPSVQNFTYAEFKKIADKTPFTQAEWASILHVSERTLQRYAKNNGNFAPINAERALQLAHVINEGKKTFGNIEMFYHWLKQKPLMLEGPLSFESLTTTHGIQLVLTQLGRIQHGILA
jgi:putative toxin-antitoxin system antitoxin component (TIGR02293 family)